MGVEREGDREGEERESGRTRAWAESAESTPPFRDGATKGWATECCGGAADFRLPGYECQSIETEEQSIRAGFGRVEKRGCERGEREGEDRGTIAGEAADEDEEAHLHQQITEEGRQAESEGVGPEDAHRSVREQMVGEWIERDGRGALDVDELRNRGGAVRLQDEKFVLRHELMVRPEE